MQVSLPRPGYMQVPLRGWLAALAGRKGTRVACEVRVTGLNIGTGPAALRRACMKRWRR